ncbi:MAG: sulfite exporter TauE/SafE family protein [Flavobacteriaceae bacterium]|nr:sulfite exporter TauE/SafE family protein [Bacteroidia bacterium]NNL16952.1 sulfite exporter TauE/SafE family protein [Flavobacteriaceae bacterium]
MNTTLVVSLIVIGLLGGMLSGMFGIGGGVIMVPLMVFLLSFTQHQAQGTSLAVLSFPVAFVAAYNYYNSGENVVDWKFAIIIGASFVLGGYLGSKLAISINQTTLRKLFSIVLLIAAIKLFFSK